MVLCSKDGDAGIVFPCDEETEETQEQTQEMPEIMKHFHMGGC